MFQRHFYHIQHWLVSKKTANTSGGQRRKYAIRMNSATQV